MNILALCSEADAHYQYVRRKLEAAGHKIATTYSFEYPGEWEIGYCLDPSANENTLFLQRGEQNLDLSAIDAVWVRKFPAPMVPVGENVAEQLYTSQEAKHFFDALTLLMPQAYWLTPPLELMKTSLKPYQLQQAVATGLKIPPTVVGNRRESFVGFLKRHDDVAIKPAYTGNLEYRFQEMYARTLEAYRDKLLAEAKDFESAERLKHWIAGTCESLKEDASFRILTNRIGRDDLEGLLPLVRGCPMIMQKYIPKRLELRITVVGTDFYTCAIDSQSCDEAATDFRGMDGFNQKLNLRSYDIPKELKQLLLRFMGRMNLEFGCIDMIVTPDEEYVFLEINPAGEWMWVEQATGLPIGDALVNFLEEKASLSKKKSL